MLSANDIFKFIALSVLGALVFVAAAYFAQTHSDEITRIVGEKNFFGMAAYVGITAASIVIASLSAVFLLPLAANVWGPALTAALSIVGWTIGAMLVFWICRSYGKPLVKKFISLKNIEWLENVFPEDFGLIRLVLLRMSIPVDILSFALGLFTSVSTKKYFLATFLGVIPFGIVASYASLLPPVYQLVASATGIFLFLCGLFLIRLSTKERATKSANDR